MVFVSRMLQDHKLMPLGILFIIPQMDRDRNGDLGGPFINVGNIPKNIALGFEVSVTSPAILNYISNSTPSLSVVVTSDSGPWNAMIRSLPFQLQKWGFFGLVRTGF